MTWPRAAPGLWRSPPSCLRSPRRRFPVPARPHATGRGCCQPPHPVITQLYRWNTSSICNRAEDRLQRLDDFPRGHCRAYVVERAAHRCHLQLGTAAAGLYACMQREPDMRAGSNMVRLQGWCEFFSAASHPEVGGVRAAQPVGGLEPHVLRFCTDVRHQRLGRLAPEARADHAVRHDLRDPGRQHIQCMKRWSRYTPCLHLIRDIH